MSKSKRLDVLEAARRELLRQHIPASDVSDMLNAVLGVLGEEAGPDVADRVGGRIVEGKEARVLDLLAGMNAAQLEEVHKRIGITEIGGRSFDELRTMTAPELVKVYFKGRHS